MDPEDDLPLPDAELGDPDDETMRRIVERPDGLHWVSADGRQEFGPYATVEEALAAMNADGEDESEPAEDLADVEQELGIADWLDPDTGAPAEGSPPRIVDR